MAFDSWADFFAMGGHALYVWSAYLITLALLLVNVWIPWAMHRAQKQRLERQIRREQARETPSTP